MNSWAADTLPCILITPTCDISLISLASYVAMYICLNVYVAISTLFIAIFCAFYVDADQLDHHYLLDMKHGAWAMSGAGAGFIVAHRA